MSKIPAYTIDDIRDSINIAPPFGDYQKYHFEDGKHTPFVSIRAVEQQERHGRQFTPHGIAKLGQF